MTDIAKLGLEIDSGQVKTADRDLKRFGKTSKTTGRKVQSATQKMQASFTRLRGSLNRSGMAFVALGAAAATATGLMVSRTLEAQDSIGKMAQQLGISTEALSELQFAAEQTGSSATQLSAGLETMSKRLGQVAATHSGEATKALDALGLSAQRLTELQPDVAFQRIATAMGDLESQSEKNAIAAQIFSRANQSLVNTLGLTEDQMKELRGEARALGRSLSEEQTQAAADAQDAINKLKSAFTGISNTMTTSLAPAITAIANGLTDDLADGMKSSRQDVLDWGQTYGDTIALIADVSGSALATLKYGFASLGSALGASVAQLGALLKGEFDQILTIQRLYIADQEKLDAELLSTNTTRYRDELAAVLAHNKEMNKARSAGLDTITVNAPLIDAPLTPAPRSASQEMERQIIDVPARIGISSQGDRDREALERITDSLKSQEDRIQESYDRRTEIVLRAVDDQEKQKTMLAGLDAQRLTSLEQLNQDAYGEMSKYATRAAENMQDSFADFLFDPFADGLGGMVDGFANTLRRMAAEQASSGILDALGGAATSYGDSNSGWMGTAASAVGSFFGGGKATGGPVSGGMLYQVNERGPEFFQPSGDGRIIPNNQLGGGGGAGGGVTNNMIVKTEPGLRVEESRKTNSTGGVDMVAMVTAVMQRDASEGGPISRTNEAIYPNLKRTGS